MALDAGSAHRTALVAGGAGGAGALGAALTQLLLERGWRVAVPYRREDPSVQSMRSRHDAAIAQGQLRLSQGDAADADQMAALLDVLRADWGPLWLACSTAGGWAGGTDVADTDDMALLDRMLMTNLRTAFVVAREGLRHMGPAGGRVVLVGSGTVKRAGAGQAAYSAAKAGLHSLVETLAEELRGTGRTANAVVPDIIDTPVNRRSMPTADRTRWMPPEAIAEVMAFLASPSSWPVNGALVPVRG